MTVHQWPHTPGCVATGGVLVLSYTTTTEDDMADTAGTATHRAINLAGVTWTDNGRHAAFQATRPGYGVEVIATGEILSKNGVTPSVWNLKSAAATIAEHAAALGWNTIQVQHPKAGA